MTRGGVAAGPVVEKTIRLAIVSCVFPPEKVVSSRTSFDIAAGAAARGHDVTVIAPFPNRPSGKLYPGYRRRLFARERHEQGFSIVRCFATLSPRSSLASRFAENLSFGITSSLAILFGRKQDVIYMNTWPIIASALLMVCARMRRTPVVITVQDVYPESLQSQRRPGSSLVAGALLAMDRWVVNGAAAVIAVSDRFAAYYRRTRGIAEGSIHVVPNWLSAEGTEENAALSAACRARHNVPDDSFLLVYGGNVGVAAGVETVIAAFAELRGDGNVHLLIAGEGSSLENCRRLAAAIGNSNIHFEAPWSDTMSVLYAADAFVLPTLGLQSVVSVPSKLIYYLRASRPIVVMALPGSDIEGIVERSGAGTVIPPDDPARTARAIREMASVSPDERRRMGQAGRRWAIEHLTRDACLPGLLNVIESTSNSV